MALLETRNLSKSFGGLRAITNLNFELEEGEVRGVIGPNGSGKSTFFNLITGIYKTDPGSQVLLNGEDTPTRATTERSGSTSRIVRRSRNVVGHVAGAIRLFAPARWVTS